ncbi:MAG: SRPBCC family protein [Solobacterium sp.]|nr:SRPBCC family protein [Solobacterium sp.]
MAEATMKIMLPYPVETVWQVVTDVRNYGWRSDVMHAKVINENQFVEVDREGIRTVYTVVDYATKRRWELDLDNDNVHGRWIATFEADGLHTVFSIEEELMAKKVIMKPFLKANVSKKVTTYMEDLKRVLKYQ